MPSYRVRRFGAQLWNWLHLWLHLHLRAVLEHRQWRLLRWPMLRLHHVRFWIIRLNHLILRNYHIFILGRIIWVCLIGIIWLDIWTITIISLFHILNYLQFLHIIYICGIHFIWVKFQIRSWWYVNWRAIVNHSSLLFCMIIRTFSSPTFHAFIFLFKDALCRIKGDIVLLSTRDYGFNSPCNLSLQSTWWCILRIASSFTCFCCS